MMGVWGGFTWPRSTIFAEAIASSNSPAEIESTAHSRSWMQPVSIDGCFGWLHGNSTSLGDTAVLICPGLGHDARSGHRSFRLLANELAAAGYPTLRFEYPGVGDSLDIEGSAQWMDWLHSIGRAADWLVAQTGARRVVLCGLRLGALLAAIVASQRSDVAGLLLLAPVVRGALYVRQNEIEAQLRAAAADAAVDGLELDEVRVSSASVKLMKQADLRALRLRADLHVAIFASASRSLSECVKAWADQAASISCADFQPLATMLRDTFLDAERQADFSGVLTWLARTLPASPTAAYRLPPLPEVGRLRPPGCIEEPIRFGKNDSLFGILCRPTEAVESDLVVVIGNSGGEPHYGFARFGVGLARALAARGIASLRMDFAGLGDSVRTIDGREITSHVYNVDRQPDVTAALDLLERRGYRRFAMHGLCSGAYHALHAGLRDSRISALVLVNLPVFTCDADETIIARSMSYYLRTVFRKQLWMKLFRGETNPLRIVSGLVARSRRGIVSAVLRAAGVLGKDGYTSFGRRCVMTLSRRGVRTLFLFSKDDPGLTNFERHLGPTCFEAACIPGMSVRIEDGLDHELSTQDMRRTVEGVTLTFVQRLPPGHRDAMGYRREAQMHNT